MDSKPPLLLSVLGGNASVIPPVWLMRQAGRYLPEYRELRQKAGSFLDLCLTPEWATQVTLQPIDRFQMDGAILFSDILIIPWALGQDLEFREGEGPCLSPPFSPHLLSVLSLEKASSRWAPVIETVRRVSKALPSSTALIGFAGSPWTVATYMIEGKSKTSFEKSLDMALNHPELLEELMELLEEATALYLREQIEAGAQAVQIFDTWASVLPPSQWDRWIYKPTRSLREKIQAYYPHIPLIGFPKGLGPEGYKAYLQETGVTALSLDSSIDLSWAKENLTCPLQGNLDPELLQSGGRPLEEAVQTIQRTLQGHPYIFNLGHGILPSTPPAHVARVLTMLRGS